MKNLSTKYVLLPLLGFAAVIASFVLVNSLWANSQSKPKKQSDVAIVLIGHGVPPSDFPRNELGRAITALNKISGHHGHHGSNAEEHSHEHHHAHVSDSHHHDEIQDRDLAKKLLNWPATRKNNPYYFGVKDIADDLKSISELPVFIGFNEFCGPTTEQAIQAALDAKFKNLIVISVMMTPGGGHSEQDILNSIKRAKASYPDAQITYAWPFPTDRIAGVLNLQVQDAIKKSKIASK